MKPVCCTTRTLCGLLAGGLLAFAGPLSADPAGECRKEAQDYAIPPEQAEDYIDGCILSRGGVPDTVGSAEEPDPAGEPGFAPPDDPGQMDGSEQTDDPGQMGGAEQTDDPGQMDAGDQMDGAEQAPVDEVLPGGEYGSY